MELTGWPASQFSTFIGKGGFESEVRFIGLASQGGTMRRENYENSRAMLA